MKLTPRYKKLLNLNLTSVFFIVVSFISVTLAWFAYSGLATTTTEIGVKSWFIELEKDGQTVSNDVVISLPEIYPGMNPITEEINIKNLGDADASVKYAIASARILDDPKDNYVIDGTSVTTSQVEDILSHNYPFHLNISLSKKYVLAKGSDSKFTVSVSWPLDSDNNQFDSDWGRLAYAFNQSEQELKNTNPEYQVRTPIRVVISIMAEQYLNAPDESDPRFNLGDEIMYDVVDNNKCSTLSSTCLQTTIIDINNQLSNTKVTLLPKITNDYLTSTYANYNNTLTSITNSWNVTTRSLMLSDILPIIARDITGSFLVRTGISDAIVGNLNDPNRFDSEVNKAINSNGYYRFMNNQFNYLSSNNCYWLNTSYDLNNAFSIKTIDTNYTKISPELKNNNCLVIPVITVDKVNI